MKFYIYLIGLICVLIACKTLSGQKVYQVPYNKSELFIDGNLNDWDKYLSISFSDTLGELSPAPGRPLKAFYDDRVDYSRTWHPLSKNTVEVWLCWNLDYLFFAFQVKDSHIFNEVEPDEDHFPIHLNDGIEVYIDTKSDSQWKMDFNDYQFSVDALGNSIVYRGDKQRFNIDTVQVPKLAGQNLYYETAVRFTNGTMDTESGYTIELAIPFTAIGIKIDTNLRLKIDLCNNDIDYSLEGAHSYADTAMRYWAFNMSGYSDFGYPETWNAIQLTGTPGWIETRSVSTISRYFMIYISVMLFSIIVIALLLIRMKYLNRLPASVELSSQSILFLDKTDLDDATFSETQMLLQKATDYIRQSCHQTINSEMLSQHLGVSLRKLQRITREELKCTPTNFIYIVKLNLAASFLQQGKANISQTAYEFGFSDPGYFSKLFHKHFGVSPMEYMTNTSSGKK